MVAVLAMVVLLAFIVVAFMQEATKRIRYYGLFHQRDDLRVQAYNALETSLAVINLYREIDGQLWGPQQGWGDPLQFAGYEPPPGVRINIRFRDESGRIPLTGIEFDTLRILLEQLDFDSSTANELADTMLDWMDEDELRRLNGFDGEDYLREDPPYKAANRMIESWDELILIEGFREAFWDEEGRPLPILNQFQNSLSLFHTGAINLNAASPLVLSVLEEQGAVDLYALSDYRYGRDGIPGTADDRLIRNPSEAGLPEGSNAGLSSTRLVVDVEVSRGDARFILSALVAWSGSNPAAGSGGNNNDSGENGGDTQNGGDTENEGAQPQPNNNRSNTRTASGLASQMGYPFQILQLSENRKI